MNINNAFPSKWLKPGDVPDDSDLILTIQTVRIETVGQGEDAEQKPVLYFAENDKGLVLNKTNANTIAQQHGPETDAWVGKRIALYATEVQFGDRMTLALRVRLKAPKANGTAPANDLLTVEQAIALADEHGISKAALKDLLKAEGKAGWQPQRDTAWLRQIIKDKELPF